MLHHFRLILHDFGFQFSAEIQIVIDSVISVREINKIRNSDKQHFNRKASFALQIT